MVVSLVVGGMIMRFMYDEHAGIVNGFFRFIGLGGIVKTWTAYPETALLSLILGSVWIWTGFPLVIYSAGLELIPGELFEAAKVDGASSWTIFWRITVPLLKPSTIIVVIMSLMWVLRVFDIVYVATFGGPGESSTVLGLLIYLNTFYKIPPDIGLASALATFLILISLPISIFLMKQTK
jgi:multiple sugar transport system permease protein